MSIKVPRVLAWSSDAANPVGAAFIIMEKVKGVALAEKWEGLTRLERYKVIDQVREMEKELAGLSFPAYGSLCLRGSLPGTKECLLPSEIDPDGRFCIGPGCTVDEGPWKDCIL